MGFILLIYSIPISYFREKAYLLEDYSDNLANKHKLGVTKEYLYDLFENIIKMEEN